MFSIAQITDLHVGRTFETKNGTLDALEQVKYTVSHLNHMRSPTKPRHDNG